MAAVASTFAPNRVCCLTGVPAPSPYHGALAGAYASKVYRRPLAFARAKHLQTIGWGAAITEIMLRERPRAALLATANEGYLGLWLQRWVRLPFVMFAHGNEILAAIKDDYPKPRMALQRAQRVLAVSQYTAGLVARAGVNPERIDIVHPGCDTKHFHPMPVNRRLRERLLGSRARDRVILTVGGLVARKGHDMVIRALPRLQKKIPQSTYLIVGDGPYRGQLEQLAVAMGVREHVVFAGQVPDEDLPQFYALSDVFVMPSREDPKACDVEGFGLVFLEANACAKPVIGGRSGGIPDAIVDNVTGLLVSSRAPEDIANALIRLLSDPDLAVRMGQEGRARVVAEFDWPRIGRHIQSILDGIVQDQVNATSFRS
jgi:phosphatidylinositol alpha-1,6-mannosyltransferase